MPMRSLRSSKLSWLSFQFSVVYNYARDGVNVKVLIAAVV